MGAQRAVSTALYLVLVMVLARSWGPDGIGAYTLALSFPALGFLVLRLGMDERTIRSLSQAPETAKEAVGRLLAFRLLAGLAGVAAMTAVSAAFVPEVATLVAVASAGFFFEYLTHALLIPFSSREEIHLEAFTLAGTDIIAVSIALLLMDRGLGGVLTGLLVGKAVGLLCGLALFVRRLGRPLLDMRHRPEMLPSLPFLVASLGVHAMLSVPLISVGALLGLREAGFFGAGMSIVRNVVSFVSVISYSLYPRLSRLWTVSRADAMRVLRKGLATLALTCAVTFGTVALLARPILVLVYGPAFEGAAGLLRLLAAGGAVLCMLILLIYAGWALGQERPVAAALGIGVMAVIISTWVLARTSTAGAAVALLAVSLVVSLAVGALLRLREKASGR